MQGDRDWRVKLYRGKYYAVRSNRGRTERQALRTDDLAIARQRLADLLKKPAGTSVGELVEVYLEEKDKTAIRAKDLRYAWKAAKDHFAHLRPDQIDRDVCRSYRANRKRDGLKPASIRKELETVRAAINYHKAPGAVFELPPQPKAKDRWLTEEEVRRLTRACRKTPHLRAFVVLSVYTAARQSALLELTWDRVDLTRRVVHLALGDDLDDARKPRAIVPLGKRAYRYLLVMRRQATSPYVIEWGGDRVRSVKRGFRAACARAKIRGVTPHVLRHTAATWMALKGVPMLQISRFLGHTTVRVTETRYAHHSPDYLREASAAIDW